MKNEGPSRREGWSGLEPQRRALLLSYFTVGFNVVEGAVSVAAGALAGSVALVGFGLDSFVESLSGGVMIWRFRNHGDLSGAEEDRVEERAASFVGYTFLLLAAYVAYESAGKLVGGTPPEPSPVGIAVAAVSLVVMPALYYLKAETGRELGSRSLVSDSKQTLACVFLSAALLLGLGLNYLFGLWWADPAVGLVIAALLVREGRDALRGGDVCC